MSSGKCAVAVEEWHSAHSPLPTPHSPLPTPHCPLATAHSPLPTAHSRKKETAIMKSSPAFPAKNRSVKNRSGDFFSVAMNEAIRVSSLTYDNEMWLLGSGTSRGKSRLGQVLSKFGSGNI